VERKLVDVMLSNPSDAMFMSVRELALRAGAHESSAVRLARKLGYDGYPALRPALQETQLEPTPAGAARRVFVWAQGNARILADMATSRLDASGIDARNISSQGRELAERLLPLQRQDAMLAFAFRRPPKALPASALTEPAPVWAWLEAQLLEVAPMAGRLFCTALVGGHRVSVIREQAPDAAIGERVRIGVPARPHAVFDAQGQRVTAAPST
jgi:Helix-turn-helix domain, rpiR family